MKPGETLKGRYRLLKMVGRGGQAAVWQAEELLGEEGSSAYVAIKAFSMPPPGQLQDRSRFEQAVAREVSALARCSHSNILAYKTWFEFEEYRCIVMEWAPGGSVEKQVVHLSKTNPLQKRLDRVRSIVHPIADALAYLGRENITHRDVKPANILYVGNTPKLGDFGIAKNTPGTFASHTGLATPEYAAPELFRAKVSPAADVYALGISIFELLTGNCPFRSDVPFAIMKMHEERDVVVPEHWPSSWTALVKGCLHKDPTKRWSAQKVLDGFEEMSQAPMRKKIAELEQAKVATQELAKRQSQEHEAALRSLQSDREREIESLKTQLTQAERSIEAFKAQAIAAPKLNVTVDDPDVRSRTGGSARWQNVLGAIVVALVGVAGGWILKADVGSNPVKTAPPPPTVALAARALKSFNDDVEMVSVPAGEFYMGCNERVGEECDSDEKPGKEVFVAAFRIDKTEVTVAQYKKCVDAGRCKKPKTSYYYNWNRSGRENHAINGVSWNDANTYCKWAGKRLPTEKEWEKAARGTDRRKYSWGNTGFGSRKVANIADRRSGHGWAAKNYDDGYKETAPVGSFPAGASPYGALDMIGNVWEWTSDWYTKDKTRAIRGGSWNFGPGVARVSFRYRYEPDERYNDLGFRCSSLVRPD